MADASQELESPRRSLRLTIVTPLQLVLDIGGVRHVRAEDPTGSFGILPGHADLLTVLSVSVLIYREGGDADEPGVVSGQERFVGLRGGVMFVSGGRHVQIFTREATLSDDLRALSAEVKSRLTQAAEQETDAYKRFARMEGALLSHMTDYLRHANRQTSVGARRTLSEP